MVLKMYSIFDSKLAAFSVPFYEHKDAVAIRKFTDAVNDGSNPNNQWFNHPEDFQLFFLGEFDDNTGELIPSKPQAMLTAAAVKLEPVQ